MMMKKFFFIILFFPATLWSQDSTKVNLNSPNKTIYNHIFYLQKDSYQPKLSAKSIYGLKEQDAIEVAIKIKRVLDGKGLYVDFNKVPKNHDFNDTIANNVVNKYILFPIRLPLVSVEKIENKWYYSEETIKNIDKIYSDVFPWHVETIQELIPVAGHKSILGIEIWQIIAVILLFILSWIVFKLAKRISYIILRRLFLGFLNLENQDVISHLKKLARPISLVIALTLISKTFPSFQFSLEINKWVFLFINISMTVFWIYVFLQLANVVSDIYSNFTQKTESKLDDQLVPILKNFLRGVVIIVGLFKVLVFLGVNPTAIIAGASIGGLAIAFASQDTVKNLIGTIMIFVDKPFHIGDWIQAGEVVGSVEEVGFRSTRVRAADTTVFQIPNSKLSEMVINNSGIRLYRRYNTQLGVRYDTPPELIEAFVKGIREILLAHPDTNSDNFLVEFNGFGDSALLIMMNMYLKDLAWASEQKSRHQIHIAIVKLAKELGVDFAFPSTTVMIEQFPDKKSLNPSYNTDLKRTNDVIAKVVDEFKLKIEEKE